MTRGVFDRTAVSAGWFAPEGQAAGWWDSILLNEVDAGAPVVTLDGIISQYWSADTTWNPATVTSTVAAGEKLVTLGVWWDDSGNNPSLVPTDSAGTFTRIVGATRVDGLYPTHAQIAAQSSPSAGSHVVTPPNVTDTGDGWFLVLRLDNVGAVVDSGSFRDAHTYVVPPTVDPDTIEACTVTTDGTACAVGDLVVAIFQIEAYSNSDIQLVGPGSPWTELGRFENVVDNIGYLACYKIATTSGAQSCSISWTDDNTFTVDAAIAVWEREAVVVTKATFDPTRKGSDYTLSSGDMVATKTNGSDQVVFLQFPRTTGKYWDEFLLGSGTNTEYVGLGVGNASASVSTYLGADTNGVQLYETVTRGTWNSLYNNGTTTVDTGGPQCGVGNVLVMVTNVDDQMFFMGLQTAGTGAVDWITGDPNTSLTSGGVDYSAVSGAVAPCWDAFYSGAVVTYRTVAQHSATAYMPSGVTQQWDDDTGGGGGPITHTKNLSYAHVSTLTKSDTISFVRTKTYSHVGTVTKTRLISKIRTFAHVGTSTATKLVELAAKTYSHVSALTQLNAFGVFRNFSYSHVSTVTKTRVISKVFAYSHVGTSSVVKLIAKSFGFVHAAVSSQARKAVDLSAKTFSHLSSLTSTEAASMNVAKTYSHVSTEVLTGKVYVPYVPPGPSTWIQRLFRLGDGF